MGVVAVTDRGISAGVEPKLLLNPQLVTPNRVDLTPVDSSNGFYYNGLAGKSIASITSSLPSIFYYRRRGKTAKQTNKQRV